MFRCFVWEWTRVICCAEETYRVCTVSVLWPNPCEVVTYFEPQPPAQFNNIFEILMICTNLCCTFSLQKWPLCLPVLNTREQWMTSGRVITAVSKKNWQVFCRKKSLVDKLIFYGYKTFALNCMKAENVLYMVLLFSLFTHNKNNFLLFYFYSRHSKSFLGAVCFTSWFRTSPH